jgi:hypothetical protein
MSGAYSTYGRGERCVQPCGGDRPLGRPRFRWEDIIKVDLQESLYETSPFVYKITRVYLFNVPHIQQRLKFILTFVVCDGY